jgi:hypothetical protein
MERGVYIDLTRLKRALSIADTVEDTRLLEVAEYASRRVDRDCGRAFYTVQATRYFAAARPGSLLVPDLLAVTALHTDDGSRTYATAWAVTDYDLEPTNGYPKWQVIAVGDYSFPAVRRGVRISGLWGYGDGESASPWTPTNIAIIVDADDTTLTVAGGTLVAGQTIKVDDEQMYMRSATEAERAVNGTTASAHNGSPVSVARYPAGIVEATRMAAEWELRVPVTGTLGGGDIGTVTSGQEFARYRGIVESFRVPGVG